jgi:hypothetical protein
LGVSRKLEGNIIDLCVFFLEGKANYCRQKKKKPERRILGRKVKTGFLGIWCSLQSKRTVTKPTKIVYSLKMEQEEEL